ncbi:hypothetical protein RlegWSM1455_07230 [Rhizobium laguerreae]|uniref:hypothetical protein n=1 Tax=Rhizobium laguerreae TaxID=1076926 RepID=UPI001E65CCF5|nr:hypothetical protein [Rhizobium laguerreae]UFW65807.1 hypothetical protein RlegWSM1455_07230 [Rhizobium laguerreae]
MITKSIIAAICILGASAAAAADIKTVRCLFRADGFEGGKSNTVSCAMTPNEVFSTNSRPKSPTEMCDQKSNRFQENYENFVADLPRKTIEYDTASVISDFAKEDYVQYIMKKDGKNHQEALKEAENRPKRHQENAIDSIDIGSREIYFRIGGGMYDPPKQMPTYIVRYGESTLYYTIGVPEAVIIEATGDERHSWVAMKFGLCESE